MITRSYSTGDSYSVEDAARLLINLRQSPLENFGLAFLGDVYFDIGALGILKLMLADERFKHRLVVDCSQLNPTNYDFISRIGLLGGGKKEGYIFPLELFSSAYRSGTLSVDVPRWLSMLAKDAFVIEDSHLVETETAIIELIANVIDHSGGRSPGVFGGAYFKQNNHIQLIVIDLGNSIPGTLQKLYPLKPDHIRLSEALKPGVSRRLGVGNNYGLGLDIVKNYAQYDINCSLKIFSRKAFLSYTNGQMHCNSCRFEFPGTYVKLQLSESFLRQSLDIQDSLRGFDL